MIRVAQILGKMNGGGAEQVVMNYYRAIDREQVQFDFYFFKGSKFVPVEDIKAMGGRMFVLPTFRHPLKYLRTLRRLLSENKYDIMHCHLSTLSFLPLLAGKQAGVRTRILHNHSTSGAPGNGTATLPNSFSSPLRSCMPPTISRVRSLRLGGCTAAAPPRRFPRNTTPCRSTAGSV